MNGSPWFDSWNNRLALAEALLAGEVFRQPKEVVELFRWPWRWNKQWERFQRTLPRDGPTQAKDGKKEEPEPEMAKPYMNRAEAGIYLRIPQGTLAVWASQKKGPLFLKAGRHAIYRKEDLDQWARERMKDA